MDKDTVKQQLAAVATASVQEHDPAKRGFALDVSVSPTHLVQAVSVLDKAGYFIETITGVDWLGEKAAQKKEALAAAAAAAKKAAEAGEPAPAEPEKEEATEPEAPAVDDLEAVYDFNHYAQCHRVTLRTRTPRNKPSLPSIVDIYPAAHWHERETHDFFGIVFEGHGYLIPLLLPEDADFHPLLKDYSA